MVAPAYHRHATIAKVVGWRIGREQAKTAEAEEGVRELEEELAEHAARAAYRRHALVTRR